jgi:hypothetical protein
MKRSVVNTLRPNASTAKGLFSRLKTGASSSFPRNLDATREKACERMGRYVDSQVMFNALVLSFYRLQESAKPLKRRLERKQRRSRDAEYREVYVFSLVLFIS